MESKEEKQQFLDRSFVLRQVIDDLLEKGELRLDMALLVFCAGPFDKKIFEHYGFTNVTLSNLSQNLKKDDFLPYASAFLDVEDVSLESNSFDWCIVHAGLHHCANPAAAVLEMYRVARVGLLAVEPIDSLLSRVTVRLGLSQEYEVASVVDKLESAGGGLRFGGLPNLVFRFSRASVTQMIQTAHPEFLHRFRFYERLGIPWSYLRIRKKPLDRLVLLFEPVIRLFVKCSPLANNIGFAVLVGQAPDDFQPWITQDENGAPIFDSSYLGKD